MVTPILSMFDPESERRQLGGQVRKRRHIDVLKPVEEYLREVAPLPASYDVGRPQPWYFSEFCYTEFCGGLLVLPQTDELAVRVLHESLQGQSKANDPVPFILDRIESAGTGDKYQLDHPGIPAKRVVMLPGSNLLTELVSRELLTRAMAEDPGLIIKPHPLTHAADLRFLRMEFGANRIMSEKASGWEALKNAEEVFTVPCSEMGAYAVLLGKQTHNIANYLTERGCSYFPVMWDVLGKPKEEAYTKLHAKFNAMSSGIIFAEDPDFKEHIDSYFSLAMTVRERFKPMVWNSHKPVIYKNAIVKD